MAGVRPTGVERQLGPEEIVVSKTDASIRREIIVAPGTA